MAKSRAKKLREKLTREGQMNPVVKRSPFVFTDMRERTTKTKKDHLYQFKHKNHQSADGNDGSFLFQSNFAFPKSQNKQFILHSTFVEIG
ncbi:hypothetical protein QNH39_21790 [Neobacillus novalis]|uniref:Uncharacterized protein n=1 Tax=Neobacillus novalis TaxID=220687 RepID=A0AA95MJV4_9BACI|nr:hypothetical protein [Neobacillus novalis]WHY85222.1 hypothetical protein QNH39_21790 [Neobacillus novalis]